MRNCRKEKARPETVWYTQADQLPDSWDVGLPEDHFLRKASLAMQEHVALPHVRQRYALLHQQGKPLARTAFQVLQVQPEHVKESALPAWQYRLWSLFTKVARPELLVGGQLFRHDVESIYWSEEISGFEAFTWYKQTIDQAISRCRATAVLIKELPAGMVPHFQHSAPNYLLLRNDISMQLPIPATWDSMQDYEKALKHKYAQRYRKVRQGMSGLSVIELSTEEIHHRSDEIFALYLQVTMHQPVRMGILSKECIPGLKSAFPERLKVWAIEEEGKMIAFASAWVNEESLDMFYIGFDYERNGPLNLYFNILFLAIEQTITLRKRHLILGRTALEAKARVGCKPLYLNTFLHIPNGFLRRIVSFLQNRLGEGGNEWEQRHPFKNSD